jgi:hypothetical protein
MRYFSERDIVPVTKRFGILYLTIFIDVLVIPFAHPYPIHGAKHPYLQYLFYPLQVLVFPVAYLPTAHYHHGNLNVFTIQ